ncbi:MAG: dihydrolipoamide acetyltransferase family protein [Planctomycetota bacterium]|nr:dihydrolipoamide acetyltransferase family protein [Planctomycetota bacterium]
MAHLILMPKAGQSMTEGRIVTWLKREGDDVARGEPLLEIETDKANLEVEALENGVLRKIFRDAGDVCPVLSAVGVIAGAEEDVDFEKLRLEASNGETSPTADPATGAPRADGAGTATEASAPAPAPAPPPPPRAPTAVAQPEAAVAAAPDARLASVAGAPAIGPGSRTAVSPLARRLASQKNVDLTTLRGSGPGGRILRRDVDAAPSRSASPADGQLVLRSLRTPYPPPSPRPPSRVPFEGMRRAIAATLQHAKSSIPHFYATISIDVTNAIQLKGARALEGVKVSVNDLVLRAVTLALQDEPGVNCRVFDDHIEYPEAVHLGIVVGSDQGLVVPVLLRAQTLDLDALSRESRRIIESAQRGKLVGTGQGTFTISNLGMYGVESFSAVINPPEGAVLAVGAVEERLVPAGGGFFPRSMLRVTLSSDHRAIDGLLAARFLSRLRFFLETARL